MLTRVLADLLPTAISILIVVTVMLITLLLTSSGENIDNIKKNITDKKGHRKAITLYQGLHIQFSHLLFRKFYSYLPSFRFVFERFGIGQRQRHCFLGVEVYLTLNILLSNLRRIAN